MGGGKCQGLISSYEKILDYESFNRVLSLKRENFVYMENKIFR